MSPTSKPDNGIGVIKIITKAVPSYGLYLYLEMKLIAINVKTEFTNNCMFYWKVSMQVSFICLHTCLQICLQIQKSSHM